MIGLEINLKKNKYIEKNEWKDDFQPFITSTQSFHGFDLSARSSSHHYIRIIQLSIRKNKQKNLILKSFPNE